MLCHFFYNICLSVTNSDYLSGHGKVVDGSLLGGANGMELGPGVQKRSGKWQRPRFTRKALMKCCLVKWILASTAPQGPGEGASCGDRGHVESG
ncbi:calsenilin-like isoform X2 [Arapaima gigas]